MQLKLSPVKVTSALNVEASATVNPSNVVLPSTSKLPVIVAFELASSVVNLPVDLVAEPIAVPSIFPALISTVANVAVPEIFALLLTSRGP